MRGKEKVLRRGGKKTTEKDERGKEKGLGKKRIGSS